jgi:hypothetical protein
MDFLNQAISLKHVNEIVKATLKDVYDIDTHLQNNIFFGINLQWPAFDLPKNYSKYFLSFHTEYIDIQWILKQAKLVYPKPIFLVTESKFSDTFIFLDNVTVTQYITIDRQLAVALKEFGAQAPTKTIPKFKISSLAFRISQYKRFVTSYLLTTFPKKDMILTYHNFLGKTEDLHNAPSIHYLDQLDFNFSKTMINFDDSYTLDDNSPIANANYNSPPFQDALINLTNESFHYSNSMLDGKNFNYPGPYITEKTFKPLLASRPFLAVGQANTYQYLNTLGFNTNFGFQIAYDKDLGDLTRIKGIFEAIDEIKNTSIDNLYASSIDAVTENHKYLISNQIIDQVAFLNKSSIEIIKSFFE